MVAVLFLILNFFFLSEFLPKGLGKGKFVLVTTVGHVFRDGGIHGVLRGVNYPL